jgi:arylsulfatase A-like enzyme
LDANKGVSDGLKARRLLDSTLVIWGGEFGRTPTSEGSNGRDHGPYGYSVWLAGGGIRGGTVYGSTDDFGFKAEQNPVQVRDLHATILHLLGLKHDQLTFYFQGLQQRLTQIDGESRVIREILT